MIAVESILHAQQRSKMIIWREKSMANNKKDVSAIIQEINDTVNLAIEKYKAENPDIDVEAILSEDQGLLPILGLLKNREVDKFVAYAKEQGTRMPFDAMEMGILAAGRKDMQTGLAEILDSLKFDKPICSKCDDKKVDRGRSKKKL
jgi:predicted site-specific integrase-resolvase